MSDKYCLITGAAGGFGKEYAFEMMKRGYIPILTDIRESTLLELKTALSEKFSVSPITIKADVTDKTETDKIFEYLKANDIKLSLVLNIVGIENEGWFDQVDSNELMAIVKTNVLGTMHILTECLKYKDEHLDIITLSSMAGFYSMPFKAVYAASKAFLINISRALNIELKDKGVNVLVACPAGVPTRQIVINRIKSQGFFGKITSSTTEKIIKDTLRLVKKGKSVYIPRFSNKVIYFISRLIPEKLRAKAILKRWKRTDKKKQEYENKALHK